MSVEKIAYIRDVIALRASAGHENWITIVQTALARLASADASVMQRHSDIMALAHAKIATAEYTTSKNADAVFGGTAKQIAIAAEKIDALHGGIENAALAKLDIATATSKHLMQSINDRAVVAINVIDVNASNDFDAITLAVRRSIDGVDEHIVDTGMGCSVLPRRYRRTPQPKSIGSSRTCASTQARRSTTPKQARRI